MGVAPEDAINALIDEAERHQRCALAARLRSALHDCDVLLHELAVTHVIVQQLKQEAYGS